MTGALAALALLRVALLVAPTSGPWVRVRLGDSPVTLEMPGKLVEQSRASVPEEGDWVRSVQEYVYSDDHVFVMASVFTGVEGTKVSDAQLQEAMTALIYGLASSEEKLRTVYTTAATYGSSFARRRQIEIGPADGVFYVDLLVVAVGHRLAAVVTLTVQRSDPVSARIMGTVRVVDPSS
ncbi:MAG: hypothetical protein IT207_00900 [Fimbriimonadaceae bacterium]|nr:hypothetical protein [Fimbriimonadaceae bacterium]